MSLPPSFRESAGKLYCFQPRYGWGWWRLGVPADDHLDYAEIDAAGAFMIRVGRVFDFDGEARGLVGRVEQVGHKFDGHWATTWTMVVGDFDLVENLCLRWDIRLGPTEPNGEGWPDDPDTPPANAGYGGVLAESLAAIERFTARGEY